MAEVSLKHRRDGVAELSFGDWMRMLRGDGARHDESVIALARLGKGNVLRISKAQWHRSFKGVRGLVCGTGNALMPGGTAGASVHLDRKVVDLLGVAEKEPLCITRQGDAYFLKQFMCRELASEAPGWMAIDEFRPHEVVRWCSSRPDVDGATPELLARMRDAMGTFRVDPMRAIADVRDERSLAAKKELLGELAPDEEQQLSAYVEAQRGSQLDNGSWANSAVTTAGTLVRLLQSGVSKRSAQIRRAVAWLEQSTEPAGMPGLFLYEEEGGRDYNRRVANGEPLHGGSSRAHRARLHKLADDYFGTFRDLVPKGTACEPHTTWATALSLQALLRCGRADSDRVKQAVRTLMLWHGKSSGCGGWCGCGIFGSTLAGRRIDTGKSVDFDAVVLPKSNRDMHFATWFTGKAGMRHMVCNAYAEDHACVRVGENLGLLIRNRLSPPDSSCTAVMQGALALHPNYKGSDLEALAAYEMTCMQNPNGAWPSHRISGMLHFLSLLEHPLATYLVYRSLPRLIRTQKDNGLWFSNGDTGFADDILVLAALKRMGLLEGLRPSGR
jgi:hypothetical protein